MNNIGNIENENILLLQGPLGTFFKRLDNEFVRQGATTYKIGFNAADSFFSNHYNYVPFRAKKEKWKSFITAFLKEKCIDKIFLFGDCRYYQSIAIKEAMKQGIEVFVFEEGYIRPDYITMERYGVNDFSHVPRDASFYKNLDTSHFDKREALPTYTKFYKRGWSATTYYVIAGLFWFLYPNYEHHRELNFITEALYGIRNAFRKYLYQLSEKDKLEKIISNYDKKYFFVPLQTFNDFQLIEHSQFNSIEEFITIVLESFSNSADDRYILVIKHHPMDRGRKNYTKYIYREAKRLSIEKERIEVVFDLHLPTLLDHAKGTITINSTVGLSSILHNTPTKVLGSAIYDIDGLTSKSISLDDFWSKQQAIDRELYTKYIEYLIENTQLNGSFYGKFPQELVKSSNI